MAARPARTGVGPRTSVTVIGDGAVGLMSVLAARRLGAERIMLMGRHEGRTGIGREFGTTDVVAARGDRGRRDTYRQVMARRGRPVEVTGAQQRPRGYSFDAVFVEVRIHPRLGRLRDVPFTLDKLL